MNMHRSMFFYENITAYLPEACHNCLENNRASFLISLKLCVDRTGRAAIRSILLLKNVSEFCPLSFNSIEYM